MQAGDYVDEEGEDGGHGEGVAGASYDVGYLDIELAVIVVDPAAINETSIHAIKANDVVGGKEAVEDKTDHASDAVFGENVHAVVNSDPELNYVFVSKSLFMTGSRTYSLFRS